LRIISALRPFSLGFLSFARGKISDRESERERGGGEEGEGGPSILFQGAFAPFASAAFANDDDDDDDDG